MKPSKSMFEETMEMLSKKGYRIVYVPHTIMEDYNATYNVMCEGRHVVAGAAKKLGIPLGEIWISELWKRYERFIVFHELREIRYRAEGSARDKAHERAGQDGKSLWGDDPLWVQMVVDIEEMDRRTKKRKRGKRAIH
jgi:competence protein ComEA